MAIVKALPKSEDGSGILCLIGDEKYNITHNTSKIKNAFTLWKLVSGGYEKLDTADTPQELEQKVGLGQFPEEDAPKAKRRTVKKN